MSQILTLSKRLSMLGYNGFEISRIINNATGGKKLQHLSQKQLSYVTKQMEKYVLLGTQYAASYSK